MREEMGDRKGGKKLSTEENGREMMINRKGMAIKEKRKKKGRNGRECWRGSEKIERERQRVCLELIMTDKRET